MQQFESLSKGFSSNYFQNGGFGAISGKLNQMEDFRQKLMEEHGDIFKRVEECLPRMMGKSIAENYYTELDFISALQFVSKKFFVTYEEKVKFKKILNDLNQSVGDGMPFVTTDIGINTYINLFRQLKKSVGNNGKHMTDDLKNINITEFNELMAICELYINTSDSPEIKKTRKAYKAYLKKNKNTSKNSRINFKSFKLLYNYFENKINKTPYESTELYKLEREMNFYQKKTIYAAAALIPMLFEKRKHYNSVTNVSEIEIEECQKFLITLSNILIMFSPLIIFNQYFIMYYLLPCSLDYLRILTYVSESNTTENLLESNVEKILRQFSDAYQSDGITAVDYISDMTLITFKFIVNIIQYRKDIQERFINLKNIDYETYYNNNLKCYNFRNSFKFRNDFSKNIFEFDSLSNFQNINGGMAEIIADIANEYEFSQNIFIYENKLIIHKNFNMSKKDIIKALYNNN